MCVPYTPKSGQNPRGFLYVRSFSFVSAFLNLVILAVLTRGFLCTFLTLFLQCFYMFSPGIILCAFLTPPKRQGICLCTLLPHPDPQGAQRKPAPCPRHARASPSQNTTNARAMPAPCPCQSSEPPEASKVKLPLRTFNPILVQAPSP